MIHNKIYISDRFFLADYPVYKERASFKGLEEIVTGDSELCKRRFCALDYDKSNIYDFTDLKLYKYPLEENQQYIFLTDIERDSFNERFLDFEFCGIDILDKFGSNSWITNYGITYDLCKNVYTKYGLMRDIVSVNKWLAKRISEKIHKELELNEFKLVAVWRKI